jgi:DNA-binding beta-propeller fold protein YncE
VSSSGDLVFVTGSSSGVNTGFDYATIAYDAVTGSERWISRYNNPQSGDDYGSRVRLSPDGATLVVTGSSIPAGWADYVTIGYDAATGKELWTSRYDGPARRDDFALGVDVSPDGERIFVTGQSTGVGTDFDFATVSYSLTTGSRVWVSRHNGPVSAEDAGISLGVSPDGTRVFVTGHEATTGYAFDYATLAYDASSGARLWLAKYNGPARREDHARGLVVSPDGGKVYVTGHSRGRRTGVDYATLAYATR